MVYSILQARLLPCTLRRFVVLPRDLHTATGRLTTIDSHGAPVTREVEIELGDPGETYVMFGPEISKGFKKDTVPNGGPFQAKAGDPNLPPLIYLKHVDTEGDHLLVDDHQNIVGIIDWQIARVVPRQEAFGPALVTADMRA